MDFSSLTFSDLYDKFFTFEFVQRREVVKRKDHKMDDISKFCFIINLEGVFYGVCLRVSGQLDIYWNMNLIESPTNGTYLF